jgi:hypothetical protein
VKKIILLAMCLVLLGTGVAFADVFNYGNDTLVDAYRGYAEYTGTVSPSSGRYYDPGIPGWTNWYDVIGSSSVFDTSGGSFDTVSRELRINTNWAGATFTDGNVAVTADLFVTVNGTVYGVALGSKNYDNFGNNSRLGNIYAVTLTSNPTGNSTYKTSQDIFGPQTGYIYGGMYDYDAAKPIPVWATGSDTGKDATVNWYTGYVTVDLSALFPTAGNYTIDFLWGSGTCANDTFEGGGRYDVVPLPPSALLLGSGLLGLVGLGWRRRKTKI